MVHWLSADRSSNALFCIYKLLHALIIPYTFSYYVAFSGDLKTFLLARRHLVGQETKEAEDIMPEALTRMALDVCYGLKYLTDLKYVHRCVSGNSALLTETIKSCVSLVVEQKVSNDNDLMN